MHMIELPILIVQDQVSAYKCKSINYRIQYRYIEIQKKVRYPRNTIPTTVPMPFQNKYTHSRIWAIQADHISG